MNVYNQLNLDDRIRIETFLQEWRKPDYIDKNVWWSYTQEDVPEMTVEEIKIVENIIIKKETLQETMLHESAHIIESLSLPNILPKTWTSLFCTP